MIVALVVILAMILAITAAATLLKVEPAPVPVRIDDVERLRRRR
jgi:hypothetical protein